MKASNLFEVERLCSGVFLVRYSSAPPIHLDFRPYFGRLPDKKPCLLQHYLAKPFDVRTIAFYEPSTDRYVPVEVRDDEDVVLPVSEIRMIRSGKTRPTLIQPEYVNVFVGLELDKIL